MNKIKKPKRLIKGDPETIQYMNYIRSLKYGEGQKDGYIRRLIAEKKIDLSKMKSPSQWLLNKYGEVAQQQHIQEPPQQQSAQHESPIFEPNENVEYNVGKPKKKQVNKNILTEAQEEAQEQRTRKELEAKQQTIKKLQDLKTSLVELRKALGVENSKYMNVLEEVRTRKGLKKIDRTNLEQAVRQKYIKNVDKIKIKYKEIFQYIQSHGLNENDLNSVHKYISNQIKSL